MATKAVNVVTFIYFCIFIYFYLNLCLIYAILCTDLLKDIAKMTTVSMTEARHDFADLADQVRMKGERVCISKNNKPALALVPLEDMQLLEMLEDMIDLREALEALEEPGSVGLEAFKEKLGI